MIKVAMNFYTEGHEETKWELMPQVPCHGDTVHYSVTDDPDDSQAWNVFHVSWALDEHSHSWHAEVALR
jgi:hypothetical protein